MSIKNYFLAMLMIAFAACKTTNNHPEADTHEHHESETTESNDPCAGVHAHGDHWTYEGETGPENWACLSENFSSCTGTSQSPIDITATLEEADLGALELKYDVSSGLNFINNGHTVQVNLNENENALILDSNAYELKQFHFHAPSEHTLNGKPSAVELHMVHLDANSHISVIGIMIEEGEENPALAAILSQIPTEVDGNNAIEAELNPTDLLPEDKSYYSYSGSLTTPPCSEGVNWFVMKNMAYASAEQIEALRNAMPENNARPVQALNDRKVMVTE